MGWHLGPTNIIKPLWTKVSIFPSRFTFHPSLSTSLHPPSSPFPSLQSTRPPPQSFLGKLVPLDLSFRLSCLLASYWTREIQTEQRVRGDEVRLFIPLIHPPLLPGPGWQGLYPSTKGSAHRGSSLQAPSCNNAPPLSLPPPI